MKLNQYLLLLLILTLSIGCVQKTEPIPATSLPHESREQVVVLHGLFRSSSSMAAIAERLEAAGYSVFNLDYDSRHETVEQMVDEIRPKLQQCCLSGNQKLHFVTHSLGGIVARAYIDRYQPKRLGRVVMLGPPNQGSELADLLSQSELAGLVFGPVLFELGTGPESVPNRLGKADFELGVIIGNRSWNWLGSMIIPGADDGTVAVRRAQMEGMDDYRIMPHTHTFIMQRDQVIDEILYFLNHGSFYGDRL